MKNVQTVAKPRVLIAESDGIVATDLQAMFKTWGFDEPSLATSMENIFTIKSEKNYDVVVIAENCQISSNWFHTIRNIMRESQSVVVFLSDFFNVHLPETLMAEKLFFLLPKPFNQNELESIACSAVGRE